MRRERSDGENLSAAARTKQQRQPRQGYDSVARLAAWKPQVLCDPSQNGFLADWPQRHKAIAGLSLLSGKALPSWSVTITGPSMTNGPLARQRMVMADIVHSLSFGEVRRRVALRLGWCGRRWRGLLNRRSDFGRLHFEHKNRLSPRGGRR